MKVNQWVILGLSLLLISCVMGPPYKPPENSVPAEYNIAGYHPTTANKYHEEWWEVFHDPTLTILIDNVKQSNLDLKAALAREEEARALYKFYTAQYFPTVNAQALPPTGAGDSTLTQVLGLFFTWTPDLFGKLRSNQAMSKANLQATAADHEYAVLNISAEIANAYWELRGDQEINRILLENIHADQSIYQTLKRNYRYGKDNYMQVLQQDALIETERAELSQNTAAINALISKIEILSGENPGALSQLLASSADIPLLDIRVNLSTPSDILHRRADVMAAERRIAAAHANVNAAIAELFPTVSLGWLLAWQKPNIIS